MFRIWLGAPAIVAVVLASAPSWAQDWKDIDCGKSKVFVSPALKCSHRPVQSPGIFESFGTYGWDGNQYFSVSMMVAGFDSYMKARTRDEFARSIRNFVSRPDEVSGWSEPFAIAGSTVIRFTWTTKVSPQRVYRCIGFSTSGPPQHDGYKFSAVGYSCKRAGEFADSDIGETLRRVTFR